MSDSIDKSSIMIALLSFSCYSLHGGGNLISEIRIMNNHIEYSVNPNFHKKFLKQDLFVNYGPEINLEKLDYAIYTMPLIMNIFSLVWFSGEEYYVDSMDRNLFESFRTLKKLFKFIYPKSEWKGEIIPRKIVDLEPQFHDIHSMNKKALLFSGGLDSTSTFFENKHDQVCLISSQGMPDLQLIDPIGWDILKKYTIKLAKKYGSSTAFFQSNYHDIFNWKAVDVLYPGFTCAQWRIQTIESPSWIGLTMPILISSRSSTLYYPGGTNWGDNLVSAAIPFVASCINAAGFKVVVDQYNKTRLQKAELIVNMVKAEALERPLLKVCTLSRGINFFKQCGKCVKCCMTMIGLIILGEDLKAYGFDYSVDQALNSTKAVMSRQVSPWSIGFFKDLQREGLRKIDRSSPMWNKLAFFLEYDMDSLKSYARGVLQRVNWYDLQKIVPEVSIPQSSKHIGEN